MDTPALPLDKRLLLCKYGARLLSGYVLPLQPEAL
jgi:hypothetical protein